MDSDANSVNIDAKAYHHGDLRAALIEAGMTLLEMAPREEPGLRQVARAVGVSASAVYRHFPDKDALLRAISAEGFRRLGEWQTLAAAQAPAGGEFAAIGRAYVCFALRSPAAFRLMFSRPPPHDVLGGAVQDQPAAMRLLRSYAPGGRAGAIRAWSLVHGLAVLALDGIVTVDDAVIAAVINDAAWTGAPEEHTRTSPLQH